jgi:hypothetical protein
VIRLGCEEWGADCGTPFLWCAQVAVEDISSWVEEIDSVLSESCGLQANMRESNAKYTEAIESFHSRMSAMESSLAQVSTGITTSGTNHESIINISTPSAFPHLIPKRHH